MNPIIYDQHRSIMGQYDPIIWDNRIQDPTQLQKKMTFGVSESPKRLPVGYRDVPLFTVPTKRYDMIQMTYNHQPGSFVDTRFNRPDLSSPDPNLGRDNQYLQQESRDLGQIPAGVVPLSDKTMKAIVANYKKNDVVNEFSETGVYELSNYIERKKISKIKVQPLTQNTNNKKDKLFMNIPKQLNMKQTVFTNDVMFET